MRWLTVLAVLAACTRRPSPAEIAERGWAAHAAVVAAGEAARSCDTAGPAMQRVFDANRADFIEAVALDRDKRRLAEAADYIASRDERYHALETRMEALAERCASTPSVVAVFDAMDSPER